MDRGLSEEVQVMRSRPSRPRWVASLPPRDMVMSGPKLLSGPMSRFMTLI